MRNYISKKGAKQKPAPKNFGKLTKKGQIYANDLLSVDTTAQTGVRKLNNK